MKLQQLRYLSAILRNGLNISTAAERLYTSQPGISRQLRLLEDELGVVLFQRNGKQLTGVTPAGRQIIAKAEEILREVRNIQTIAKEHRDDRRGTLTIATTHTQARYALPAVIRGFRERYPEVVLNLHQGSPAQIAEMAASGEADVAIATEAPELFEELVMLPCYRWNRCVVVPQAHPLAGGVRLGLEAIAEQPLVTYVFGFTGRSRLDEAFQAAGLTPRVVLTATDAEVIKTYVRLGLGAGIIAGMAYDPERDRDLVRLEAGHLFQASTAMIGFRRGTMLRGYMYELIRAFAPHLDRGAIEAAEAAEGPGAVDALFAGVELPEH